MTTRQASGSGPSLKEGIGRRLMVFLSLGTGMFTLPGTRRDAGTRPRTAWRGGLLPDHAERGAGRMRRVSARPKWNRNKPAEIAQWGRQRAALPRPSTE